MILWNFITEKVANIFSLVPITVIKPVTSEEFEDWDLNDPCIYRSRYTM